MQRQNSVSIEDGAEIRSRTLATGNGGDVTLNVPNLTMSSGSFVSTQTFGTGDAGNIEINSENIDLTVNAAITTDSGAGSQGRAGKIDINTTTLNIERDAEGTEGSSAGISSSTLGSGDANDINIQASESISLKGQSTIQSIVRARRNLSTIRGGVGVPLPSEIGNGKGGNITIATGSLTLVGGGEIFSGTEGFGDAGNIKIDADSISLSGTGRGTSDIPFRSAIASSVDNALAVGNSGLLEINTSTLTVSDGAEISAATMGEGNASDITINASENVLIENQSNVASAADVNSNGNGGDVKINTQDLDINNEGQVNTSNFGQGNGGDVFVIVDRASLNNGQISAANEPVVVEGSELTGGEVNFEIADIVTLDNGSLISARAGSGANGGNINLGTDVILAFPDGNNDIVANAEAGRGGNINIATEALFGIEERPLNSFSNDINASSEFGLDGGIAINTPNVDPTSGLIELPASVGDASDQISQNSCQQGVGSEFIVTGKGGLPSNPTETLNDSSVDVGLVEPLNLSPSPSVIRREEKDSVTEAKSTPAQGWIVSEKGEVTLTAYSNNGKEVNRSQEQLKSYCSSQN